MGSSGLNFKDTLFTNFNPFFNKWEDEEDDTHVKANWDDSDEEEEVLEESATRFDADAGRCSNSELKLPMILGAGLPFQYWEWRSTVSENEPEQATSSSTNVTASSSNNVTALSSNNVTASSSNNVTALSSNIVHCDILNCRICGVTDEHLLQSQIGNTVGKSKKNKPKKNKTKVLLPDPVGIPKVQGKKQKKPGNTAGNVEKNEAKKKRKRNEKLANSSSTCKDKTKINDRVDPKFELKLQTWPKLGTKELTSKTKVHSRKPIFKNTEKKKKKIEIPLVMFAIPPLSECTKENEEQIELMAKQRIVKRELQIISSLMDNLFTEKRRCIEKQVIRKCVKKIRYPKYSRCGRSAKKKFLVFASTNILHV